MNRGSRSVRIVAASVVLLTIAAALVIAGLSVYRPVNQGRSESDQQAIKREFEHIRGPASQELAALNLRDEIIAIEIEGEWAIVEFGGVYLDSGEPVPAGPGLMIIRKTDGRWRGAEQGTELYKTWLDQVPDSLLSPAAKDLLR